MTTPMMYISFLVRLWREGNPELPETTADWQSEIEHIQSGGRWRFSNMDKLLRFLRQQVEDQATVGQPADN